MFRLQYKPLVPIIPRLIPPLAHPVAQHLLKNLEKQHRPQLIFRPKISKNQYTNAAAGQKGVIISPGNFKISADKKNGKWSGTISIKGSTGEKSGHIHSSTGKGISFSFTGNLDTRNTLCHFPGLQFAGTGFQTGIFTCGTVKTVKYTETSTGNTNTFKVRITWQPRVHQNGKRSELDRISLIFIFQGSKSNAFYDFHWQTAMLYFSLSFRKVGVLHGSFNRG